MAMMVHYDDRIVRVVRNVPDKTAVDLDLPQGSRLI